MKNDRAGQMEAFVRSVQLGGFSSAARDLGLSPSALSKLVSRLEERLRVRLLNRTTRKLSLTPEGQEFYAMSARILAQLDEAETEIANLHDRPSGLLRMRSFSAFAMYQLSPAMPRFLASYPEVRLDLTVSDLLVSTLEEEVDLAVSLGPLQNSTLHARNICDVELLVCAAPAYLERCGTPATPDQLAQHNCICTSASPERRRWLFTAGRRTHTANVGGNMVVNTGEIALQLALVGVGIVRLADLRVAEHLRDGSLVLLLNDGYRAESLPMNIVYHHGKHRSPKVTAMVDFLCQEFSGAPWKMAS